MLQQIRPHPLKILHSPRNQLPLACNPIMSPPHTDSIGVSPLTCAFNSPLDYFPMYKGKRKDIVCDLDYQRVRCILRYRYVYTCHLYIVEVVGNRIVEFAKHFCKKIRIIGNNVFIFVLLNSTKLSFLRWWRQRK